MPPVSVTFNFETAAEAVAFLEARTGQAAASAPEAAPAAPKAPRSRPAPAAAPAAAPAPAPAPAAPAAAPAADSKKQAIEAVVRLINANDAIGRNGKQVCTDLCLTFGGANVSKIDPSKYPDLIKAADAARAALTEDPAA